MCRINSFIHTHWTSLCGNCCKLFKVKAWSQLFFDEIIANELLLTIKTNQNGSVNYDILKEQEGPKTDGDASSSGFRFDVEHYEVTNSAFTYLDEESNTQFHATEINHYGNGIFSGGKSELETKTETKVSLSVDSTNYLYNTKIKGSTFFIEWHPRLLSL